MLNVLYEFQINIVCFFIFVYLDVIDKIIYVQV